ncbi:benzoate 4-monooxygenase cytochrome P450 [Karstenula rhodostoma CBS 690.94]|uniref:Benzoate 4-monooxygenase cytochrome P450 n=1 Tax=Karstenula rhodostoma CBS 690.94 TaxID=1392251 RepID=A0A9P4PBB8_9PLEO|nr:benzoate 4-monooxygenase cytochrome P450 [Karstenula rhodostoma CBS 690.94]
MWVSAFSPWEALTYAAVALTGYIISLCAYRVFFHPLAKYPGPLSYKLSGWPLVWQAYKGDRHIWHLLDHDKYGPVVRIAPNTLSFNTTSAVHAIYGTRTANVKKGEWYKTFDIAAGTYSSFTETDREKHAIKRRWMAPAFSTESVKANEPLLINIIERFCESLKPEGDGWGAKWNAHQMGVYLGFDLMGALVFGSDFKSVQEEGNRDLADCVLPAQKLLYWLSYLPVASLVRPFLRSQLLEIVGGKPVRDNNRLIDYGKAQVQARRSNEDNEKGFNDAIDFLSKLAYNGDKKTGWQPSSLDLDTESLNMIIAGADPFSQVFTGTLFYLVHNADCLKKVTSEIRSTFASPSEIVSGPKMNSCTYLHACIEESLRRLAPVPSHVPRVVLPGGTTVDGTYLPPGTVVGVPQYALHHNPAYFAAPFAFSPERWLPSSSNPQSAIDEMRRAFEPFGLGVRGCIGKNHAYAQLKLSLAHFLWRFEIRECEGEKGVGCGRPGLGTGRERVDEYQLWDALGAVRDGPVVEVKWAW